MENAAEAALTLEVMRVPLALVIVPLAFFASSARSGEVSGRYSSHLSASDVAQIKGVISKETGVAHNLKKIDAVAPDKVAIQTGGRTGMDSATYYDFIIYKRAGKWTIDEKSIEIRIESTPDHRSDSDAAGR
jgi:hypothetical protein